MTAICLSYALLPHMAWMASSSLLPFGPPLEYNNLRMTPADVAWLAQPNARGLDEDQSADSLFCAVANENTISAALLQAGASPWQDTFATAITGDDMTPLEIFDTYNV